jgi:hypothetical protein
MLARRRVGLIPVLGTYGELVRDLITLGSGTRGTVGIDASLRDHQSMR